MTARKSLRMRRLEQPEARAAGACVPPMLSFENPRKCRPA